MGQEKIIQMKKRLCIGIQDQDSEWRAVLDQIGIWFEETDYSKDLTTNYSVLILNKKPNDEQLRSLNAYLENGGAIVELSECSAFIDKTETRSYQARTIINDSDHIAFRHIPYIDLYSTIRVHRDSSLFEGLVHFKSLENGRLAYFGAPIQHLMQTYGYTRKRFYSQIGAFPDEMVNKISKHQLLEAFTATIIELHIQRGLPFIRKWTSPDKKPVFCFRIDSDFGDQESVHTLYNVLNKNRISGTWFLHVQAHEDWLDVFHSFTDQEIALHGYEHGKTSSTSKATSNILKGKNLLEDVQFDPQGFCAPYGIKNDAIKDALSKFNFIYTSEFSFGYDGLPIQSKDRSQPLQIPIHPICTGSLNRVKYSVQEMASYFKFVLNNKIARFEPALFYHHPMQPGLAAIEDLFEMVNDHKLKSISFLEFARFWLSRQEFSFEAWLEDGEVKVERLTDHGKYLQVLTGHRSFYLMKGSDDKTASVKTSEFEYSNSYLPEPDEVKNMRNRNLQLIKTSLLDWKNRIQL